jgi:hypothetical protein
MPYRYTSRIKNKITPEVESKIREVFEYFPEFDNTTISIGTIISRKYGTAEVGGNKINLKVGRKHPYKNTIAHELMHLLQDRDGFDVPQGERSCDLFVCARSPELLDDMPQYLSLPLTKADLDCKFTRTLIHLTARKALNERANGNRRYIKWFEVELSKLFGKKSNKD